MADISKVKKIANDENPGGNAKVKPGNFVYKRMDAAPLDSTAIFFNKNDAIAYANGSSEKAYQHGTKSYVGQLITVIDENEDDTKTIATTYQIQNQAGDLKKLLAEPLKGIEFDFDTYTLGVIIEQLISALGGTVKKSS